MPGVRRSDFEGLGSVGGKFLNGVTINSCLDAGIAGLQDGNLIRADVDGFARPAGFQVDVDVARRLGGEGDVVKGGGLEVLWR